MKYFWLFVKQYKRKAALTLCLLTGQVVGTLLIPFLIAGVVDQGILKGDMDAVIRIGIQMLAVSLGAMAVSVWGSYASADLGALFGKEMREKLIHQSQELSVRQFEELGVSSMITRATSDIASLQQTLGMMLQMVVPAPVIVVCSVAMTAVVSAPVAILLVLFMILFLIFAVIMLKKSEVLSGSIQVRLDRINRVVRESITGVRVIRAFGNERYEEMRSGKAYEGYADNMIRLNKLFAVLNPAVWLLMGMLMASVVALGGVFALKGTMAVGEITAVSEYAVITLSYLIMAAATMSSYPKAKACLDRLQAVLDTVPAIADPGSLSHTTPLGTNRHSHAAVQFGNVTFAYPGAEDAVIRDLSFECMPGETTAVIGGTGSGKSTVADLLLRLHDVGAGCIRVNGRDIRDLTRQQLIGSIGYVPQKAFLFSGTIADNLRMGRVDVTEQEMWEALRIAQAEDFVRGLKGMLEASVSQGGTNFSGGQRQRLSIARALVRRASVLIFDDSFSALDARTDAALRRELKNCITEPARIIIAQRVSTILDAQRILVLDEGRLAGAGTHEELMENCSVYRAIADSQMKRKEA